MLVEILIFGGALVASSIFLVLWNGKKKSTSGRPYPPSLPSLPLVGSLPFIRDFERLPEFCMKQADRLGPIFTIQIGSRMTLLLSSKEVVDEAFVKHSASFSGREGFYTEKYLLNKDTRGIINMSFCEEYKKYHHLTLTILKEFGFGSKNLMEAMIHAEVTSMIEYLREIDGKSFKAKDLAMLGSSNIIQNILFGYRRDYALGINDTSRYMTEFINNMDPALDLIPILRFLPSHRRKLQNMIAVNEQLFAAIDEEIKKILTGDGKDCFVRRYIEKEGPGYDNEQLKFTVRDFVAAGTDTTGTTLQWVFLLLANNPQVQKRLHEEIDAAVARDTLPSVDDKARLPYLEATILETMRIKTLIPFGVPRVTLSDTVVSGFFIPAGVVVLANQYAVHKNPKVWKDPDVFNPERFLDKDNNLVGKDLIIPFSVGRRSCLGEVLARQELSLIIAGLLQNFTIKPPEGQNEIVVETIYGVVTAPSSYQVRMIARNE